MKIKSNAAPDEYSSPFFKANKEFCSKFETFIASKKGKVKGSYNAWSYLIHGKISKPKKWDLIYKKSTITSTGNLLFSSKFQSLFVSVIWETDIESKENIQFLIRKKTLIDGVKKLINKPIRDLGIFDKYVIITKYEKSKLIIDLLQVLNDLFVSEEMYNISFNNNKLKIELRTEKHYLEVFDKLLSKVK